MLTARRIQAGESPLGSVARGVGTGLLTLVLAMLPVALFVVYCFSSLNPDAPCLR